MTAYAQRALDIPEADLVRTMLLGHAKILTPFLDVSEPIRRTIGVQPAIRRNTVDDDRGVPERAEEQILVLGVEPVDVGLDQTPDFSGRRTGHGYHTRLSSLGGGKILPELFEGFVGTK